MTNNVKGRGVRIEIAQTYATKLVVTQVSNAKPAVATAPGHTLVDGEAGYFDNVVGMDQLTGQAIQVDNTTPTTFELPGLNTTQMGVYLSGDFYAAATWVTLAEATAYTIGGGAGTKLNATRLIDTITQEEQGNLAAQTFQIKLLAQTVPSVAGDMLDQLAQGAGVALVRVTLADGAQRLFYGEPSLSGEDVGQGALGLGTIDFTVKGFVLKVAAVA
jgi:hypothetical protein